MIDGFKNQISLGSKEGNSYFNIIFRFYSFTSASKFSSLTSSLGVCFDQTQDDITWNSHLLQNVQKHAEI